MKEIFFEKFEKPSEIDGEMFIWRNKKGNIHRGNYRPAIIDYENGVAYFYINGKEIKTQTIRTYEEHIKLIMNNFNFIAVQKTMEALNWKWVSENSIQYELKVPNLKELKKAVKYLLKRTVKNFLEEKGFYEEYKKSSISTGGFCAECSINGLTLQFIVSEYSTITYF